MKPREISFCAKRRHPWTDPADAEKCCNGWHRELRVGISSDGKPWYAHVWVKDEEEGVSRDTGLATNRSRA